jgi:hypothetical protein
MLLQEAREQLERAYRAPAAVPLTRKRRTAWAVAIATLTALAIAAFQALPWDLYLQLPTLHDIPPPPFALVH